MLEQDSSIDAPRMTKLESFEIGFERVTEEDGSRSDEVGEEEGLDFGEGEDGFGESFGSDSGPSERVGEKVVREREGKTRERTRRRKEKRETNLVR